MAEDDLVHFIIQAVDRLPLRTFAVNNKGCGDEQYPPHMMIALLIYCYAKGLFSSRRIERATHRDVAVRGLTAATTSPPRRPSHQTRPPAIPTPLTTAVRQVRQAPCEVGRCQWTRKPADELERRLREALQQRVDHRQRPTSLAQALLHLRRLYARL